MRFCLILFSLFFLIFAADDPRLHHHGVCIVEFQSNDQPNYYLTWSSDFEYGWEHNIYKSIINFDTGGNLVTSINDQNYIGELWDEAQEPVHASINLNNNYILSVWEDGSDPDGPNVRGQIHLPNGNIIKENWIIAGGDGSQHSAQAAHLGNRYLIFYADEAPPATVGAVLKGKVIDHITGEEVQTIQFSPNDEDHWWPITVSNKNNSRTLIIWGNDGYSVMGTVLFDDAGTIKMTQLPQDYLVNTQQYFYHATWLDNISRFLIIARHGAYENLSNQSRVCLIDTLGNRTHTEIIDGGILREARMACKWDKYTNKYDIFYPSNSNELTHFSINNIISISSQSEQITNHPDLKNIKWLSTGIWSIFVKDIQNNDHWNDEHIALFIQNDTLSNNIMKIPVHLSTSLFHSTFKQETSIKSFLKFKSKYLRIKLENKYFGEKMKISIFNVLGQNVLSNEVLVYNSFIDLDISQLTVGQYFYKIKI